MSNISKKTDINKIIPTKTFFHRNQKSFQYQNTLSPKLCPNNFQNIDKSIKSQINKIKFEFNNYTNQNLISKELSSIEKKFKRKFNYKMSKQNKKMSNQRSYDNLPIKNMKIKENNIQERNEGIKYNYSLKVLKTNFHKIYQGNKIKSVDIDLNIDNIASPKNNFSLIIKNTQLNKRKVSNSKNINIKKRKTEFSYKTKFVKNKFESFNTENNNVIDKIKKYTNPNTIISKCFKTNKSKINHQREKTKDRIILNLKQNKTNKYKLNKKVERRKLSFDLINNIEKNLNIETIGKYSPKTYRNNEKNNLINSSKNIIKSNKHFPEPQKTEDIYNYSLNTENEQSIHKGINQIKINNYIINKPKEENLRFSSLKFYDNEERTERACDISKIIIGQIEGYKDIIDQDKSKSIMELLSKVSFSYAKNNNINKQSIENNENINSNFFFDDVNYINSNNKEINNINITNIKNVDEDYDSEDLSDIIRNNIKSINTHSKEYIYKRKIKLNYKSNIKTSMNTNNTTISSKEKNNNLNIKSNNINENILSPIKFETKHKNSKNKISNFSLNKREKYFQNKSDRNTLKILNKNELKKNLNSALSKQLNSMKSTVNVHKKIDTNSIFNSPKKSKKKIKPKFSNDININKNKSPIKNLYKKEALNNNKNKNKKKENEINNKISNNSLISTIINNGDNETIVNACFNDVDNDICNNNKSINKNINEDINKDKNNFNQCILF